MRNCSWKEKIVVTPQDMKVLIADDDLTTCLLLERLIRSRGLQCDFVHDGSAAVLAMQNQEYALAFIDLFMPIENGDEAVARMNCASCKCQVPMMVGILSFEDDGLRKRCITAGMVDVIVKPFCLSSVNGFVDLVLGSSIALARSTCSCVPHPHIAFPLCQAQTLPYAESLASSGTQPTPARDLGELDPAWTLEFARSIIYLYERRGSPRPSFKERPERQKRPSAASAPTLGKRTAR